MSSWDSCPAGRKEGRGFSAGVLCSARLSRRGAPQPAGFAGPGWAAGLRRAGPFLQHARLRLARNDGGKPCKVFFLYSITRYLRVVVF